MGVGIGYQRQIADSLFGLNISYITDPYLVRMGRDYINYQVGILAVMVAGICCFVVTPTFEPDHQSVLAEKFYESIAAGYNIPTLVKQTFHYQIQLCATETGISLAVFAHFFNNQRFNSIFSKFLIVIFIIGLSAITKQPAKSAQPIFRAFLARQTYRLVPDFFLIGMLNVSSATLIIVS